MLSSYFMELKLDCSDRNFAVGGFLNSNDLSVGGHLWRIRCYPHGCPHEHYNHGNGGDHISFFVELRSRSPPQSGIKAIFQAFAMDGGGPSRQFTHLLTSSVQVYPPEFAVHGGCHRVDKRASDLRPLCNADGCITLVCGIIVLGAGHGGGAIDVPESDVVAHPGDLLKSGVGTDVSFTVDGETYKAHRAVLAARSPVFRAELCGATSDATSPSITLHDVDPEAFRVMLNFMYTDALPDDDELAGSDGSPVDMFQHLLAAADLYALDRLKLMCAQKIWEHVTVETVASALVFAETYSCPELKSKCMDFFAVDENLKEVVFTKRFLGLVQEFPLLAAELKKRVRK